MPRNLASWTNTKLLSPNRHGFPSSLAQNGSSLCRQWVLFSNCSITFPTSTPYWGTPTHYLDLNLDNIPLPLGTFTNSQNSGQGYHTLHSKCTLNTRELTKPYNNFLFTCEHVYSLHWLLLSAWYKTLKTQTLKEYLGKKEILITQATSTTFSLSFHAIIPNLDTHPLIGLNYG